MKNPICLLLLVITIHTCLLSMADMQDGAGNKIVVSISPARSLSTAFLRMIYARGDFTVMHEPFNAVCISKKRPEQFSRDFSKAVHSFYGEVLDEIYTKAKSGQIFVKDLITPVVDLRLEEQAFFTDPRVYFLFLIRNPHGNIISCYKKSLDVQSYCHEAYKNVLELLQYLNIYGTRKPLVIFSEDLYSPASQAVKSFCDFVSIEFKEDSLSWQNLGDNFNGSEWQDEKNQETIYEWHGNAIYSTGFKEQSVYGIDADGKPTFSEIENFAHRQSCFKTYEKCMIFYGQIRELA